VIEEYGKCAGLDIFLSQIESVIIVDVIDSVIRQFYDIAVGIGPPEKPVFVGGGTAFDAKSIATPSAHGECLGVTKMGFHDFGLADQAGGKIPGSGDNHGGDNHDNHHDKNNFDKGIAVVIFELVYTHRYYKVLYLILVKKNFHVLT
jgi:hypothetical protein